MKRTQEFVYKSDIDPKEENKRVDPKTGAFYIAHLRENDTTGRSKTKVGGGEKNLGDIYNDPFAEFGQRSIQYSKQELEDFKRVTNEYIINNPVVQRSEIVENIPEQVSGKIIKLEKNTVIQEDDPFFAFQGDLRHLVRSHQYVLTVTVKLNPKIMQARYAKEYGTPKPIARDLDFIKNEIKQCGLMCNNQEELDIRDAVNFGLIDKKDFQDTGNEDTGIIMLSFQFSELYEDVQEQPPLEEELIHLNIKTITPFIEDRLTLRLLLVPENIMIFPRKYHIEKFFFSVT